MNAKTGFSLGIWVLLLMPVMSWLLISPVRMFAFKFRSFSFKGNESAISLLRCPCPVGRLGCPGRPGYHSALYRRFGGKLDRDAKEP